MRVGVARYVGAMSHKHEEDEHERQRDERARIYADVVDLG